MPVTIRRNGDGSRRDRDDRGFALILVIWVLALLALLGAEVAADSHSASVVARNRLDLAQLRASADAGVTLAIMGLLDPVAASRWQADGRVYDRAFAGVPLAITVWDEGGKIDLNAAPKELIAGLLNEFGVGGSRQALITQGIVARRAQFVPSAPSAAPSNTGRIFGRSYVLNLGRLAFADISELRLIPGMSRSLYARLEADITVYSQNPTINPLTASREAMLAIPGAGPADADAIMASREEGAAGLGAEELSKMALYARPNTLHVVTITVEAGQRGRAFFTRRAVVAVAPDRPLERVRILRWEQPPDISPGEEIARR